MLNSALNILLKGAFSLLEEAKHISYSSSHKYRSIDDGNRFYEETQLKLMDELIGVLSKYDYHKDILDITKLTNKNISANLSNEKKVVVSLIPEKEAFICDYPSYSISIGIVENFEIMSAVVVTPATGEVFSAAKGVGAYCNNRRIRVSKINSDKSWICSLDNKSISYCMNSITQQGAKVILNVSQQVDIINLAVGKIQALYFIEMLPLFNIGALIAKEAGAIIIDENKENLSFSSKIMVGTCHRKFFKFILKKAINDKLIQHKA